MERLTGPVARARPRLRLLALALTALICALAGPAADEAGARLINGFPPEVVGNAAVGERLVCGAGSWSGVPEFSYEWIRDGTPVAPGITYFVRLEDKGHSLWCEVTATIRGEISESVTLESSNSLRIPGEAERPPVALEAPAVAGKPAVGEPLSCSTGRWSGNPTPTFTYEWVRDPGPEEAVVPSATASTYTVSGEDPGHSLACRVSAHNSAGSASMLSSNRLAVPGEAPKAQVPPRVLGVEPSAMGELLTCTEGTWSGSPRPAFKYQWFRDEREPIASANASVYTLEAADQRHFLSCKVIATNSAGSAEAASANRIEVRGSQPENTQAPALQALGPLAVGVVLTCDAGKWTGNPSPALSYAWVRDQGLPDQEVISMATSSEYTTVSADAGKTLSCQVTAKNSEGNASQFSQRLVIPGGGGTKPQNTMPPLASGEAKLGGTLTCSEGMWSGTPQPALTFQWLRDKTPIAGATNPAYVVVEADEGHPLKCQVTAINREGIAATESNELAIPAVAPAMIEAPQVVGPPALNAVIACLQGKWSGAPRPALTTQWLRDGSAIAGASQKTYTVTGEDRGASISCRVTASNGAGSAEASSSNALQIPGNGPRNAALPKLSGTPVIGATLTCSTGTWNAQPPPTFAFRWLREGVEIPAATTSAYEVTAADRGLGLSCKVIATNREGTAIASSEPLHVPGIKPENSEAPHLSGAAGVGQQLTCLRGVWNGKPPPAFTYHWLRDSTAIAAATSSSYTVELADEGHVLACRVTATNSEGQAEAESSNSLLVARPTIQSESTREPTLRPPTIPPPRTTAAEILAALHVQLARLQHHVHLASLRKTGYYTFSFFAPDAGKLEFVWYEPLKGARRSAKAKPVVLAFAATTFSSAGSKTVKLALTAVGRRAIKSSSRIPLSVKGVFARPHEAPVTWTANYLFSH